MGAAVAMHRVPPPRSQLIPPRSRAKLTTVTPVANLPTKKCHHLPFQCRKCKESVTMAYPLAVTFWKFNCISCGMDYSIEIIGNRKCLVFEQFGRKTVERISLTNERSSYYRAKCYGCGTAIIARKEEMNQTKSCHNCHMDFSICEVQNEAYYQTVIQYQDKPVTFRDKVQTLEGHIINKDNMFFLDDDIVDASQRALVETLSSLENEVAMLRNREESNKTTLLQMHAKKTDLAQLLKKQLDKSAGLNQSLQSMEERAYVLEQEKQSYAERMNGYGELVRDLDKKMAVSARLESQVEQLNRSIQTLNSDKQQLQNKLVGYTELLNAAQQAKTTIVELQNANALLHTEQNQLKHKNRLLFERVNSYSDLAANLDRQTERASKFETMYMEVAAKAKKLVADNHLLANRLTGHGEVLRDLDRQMENVVQLKKLNRGLSDEISTLRQKNSQFAEQIANDSAVLKKWEQEKQRLMELDKINRESARKMERLVGENRLLSNLLRDHESRVATLEKQLQQEKGNLAVKLKAQAGLQARIAELEAELGVLRSKEIGKRARGHEQRDEPKEDWYCEEGEALGISLREKGYQERQVLGLKGKPTPERIKVALRRRVKKYHPDMVASMGEELKAVAHRKTQEITNAYGQLMRMYAHG